MGGRRLFLSLVVAVALFAAAIAAIRWAGRTRMERRTSVAIEGSGAGRIHGPLRTEGALRVDTVGSVDGVGPEPCAAWAASVRRVAVEAGPVRLVVTVAPGRQGV